MTNSITITEAEVAAKLGGTASGSDWNIFGFTVLNATIASYTAYQVYYYTELMTQTRLDGFTANQMSLTNEVARYSAAVDVLNVIKGKCLTAPAINLTGISVNKSNYYQIVIETIKEFKEKINEIRRMIMYNADFVSAPVSSIDGELVELAGVSLNEDANTVM